MEGIGQQKGKIKNRLSIWNNLTPSAKRVIVNELAGLVISSVASNPKINSQIIENTIGNVLSTYKEIPELSELVREELIRLGFLIEM